MIQTIHEHSIDLDLLTGGWVIDAGCRNWNFSKMMKDFGEKVYALDLEALSKPDNIDFFVQKPLLSTSREITVNILNDPNASFVDSTRHSRSINSFSLASITLPEIYEQVGLEIDVLKLDIEGSEYEILTDPNFLPIPRQISVEFHEHCFPDKHAIHFESCLLNLQKNYEPFNLHRVPMHGCNPNYWDVLFIRKDLLH